MTWLGAEPVLQELEFPHENLSVVAKNVILRCVRVPVSIKQNVAYSYLSINHIPHSE